MYLKISAKRLLISAKNLRRNFRKKVSWKDKKSFIRAFRSFQWKISTESWKWFISSPPHYCHFLPLDLVSCISSSVRSKHSKSHWKAAQRWKSFSPKKSFSCPWDAEEKGIIDLDFCTEIFSWRTRFNILGVRTEDGRKVSWTMDVYPKMLYE